MMNERDLSIILAIISATAAILGLLKDIISKKVIIILFLMIPLEIIISLEKFGIIGYTVEYGWSLKSMGTIVLAVISGLYIAIVTMVSVPRLINFKVRNICPSFLFLSYMDHFASNGWSRYEFVHYDDAPCIKICLRIFHQNIEGNPSFTTFGDCGVIFEKILDFPYISKGLKISDKRFIEIQLKGDTGGEKVGLAIKNTDGEEMKVDFCKLLNGRIPNTWNTVKVDLPKCFKNVVIGQNRDKYMENLYVFSWIV